MSAPVLAWQDEDFRALAVLVSTGLAPLLLAVVHRYGDAWVVEVWSIGDDNGSRLLLRDVLGDSPRVFPVPTTVLLAAETWLRENVRGIAWPDPDEAEPETTVTAGEDSMCDGRWSPWPDVFLGRPTCQMAATTSDPTAELRALLINGHCPVCEREIGIYPPNLALGNHAPGCALDAAIVADPTAMNAKRVDILQTMATAPAAIADDLAEAVYAIDLELMRCMSLLQETRARFEEKGR